MYLGVFFYYCCLNTIVSINSSSALNITMNKHYPEYYFDHHFFLLVDMRALIEKLKLMGGAMKSFSKKLLGDINPFFNCCIGH